MNFGVNVTVYQPEYEFGGENLKFFCPFTIRVRVWFTKLSLELAQSIVCCFKTLSTECRA